MQVIFVKSVFTSHELEHEVNTQERHAAIPLSAAYWKGRNQASPERNSRT